MFASLARLRDGIDERRLAALHDIHGAPDGGTKVFGIGDRPFGIKPMLCASFA